MPLSVGDKLGPYEILAPIGKGGMGEVYRARDTRLHRDVAVKVSAEHFTERFEREARAIASLNHANICQLYDVGPNYLIMELIDGPTLAERIKEGALPLEEALTIARQIADALEAAHEKGVTHRDLKPGNIKIKPDGIVKVLDFGLAKMGGTPTAPSENSPTVSMSQTEAGMILGTAAYMSPEQAKGKPVDPRSDIYAFGVVLYEMLTGARLHHGETTTEVLASVIKEEPRWDEVPPQVRRLLRRCLEKDPLKRQRHIGDVMALVDDAPAVPAPAAVPSTRGHRWVWPVVAGLAVASGTVAVWAPWRGKANLQPVRFEIQPTEKLSFLPIGGNPQVSPDGRWVVFPATGSDGVTRMWLRALDSVDVRPLAGTEGPTLPPPAFWSPDSRFIAFSTGAGNTAPGQLRKIDISGGPPQTICDVPATVIGGAWNRDGTIVFGSNIGGLMRVSASGGLATAVTALDSSRSERAHRYPQFLPDGRHFLYHRASAKSEYTGIYVGSLDAAPEDQSLKPALLANEQGMYAASLTGGPGRLLFMRDTTLFAQTFDPGNLKLSGDPVPVADQVGSFPAANAGTFSGSETVLAYRAGIGGLQSRLTWFNSQGKTIEVVGDSSYYGNPALSPDGARLAVSQFDLQGGNRNLWIVDLQRGTSTRLTFTKGRDDFPVWSPDGKSIIFASNRNGHMDLYQKLADGSGEERLLLKSDEDKFVDNWSPDGRFLLYESLNPSTQEDLWILPLEGDRNPFPFLRTEFRELNGRFSPDGHWIAYASYESGATEVYVQPFSPGKAASGSKWIISKGGGSFPRWRADGKELFYLAIPRIEQMAVDVAAGGTPDKTFRPGVPRRLFAAPFPYTRSETAADGKRFLYAVQGGTNAQTPFTVVLNWQAGLRK